MMMGGMHGMGMMNPMMMNGMGMHGMGMMNPMMGGMGMMGMHGMNPMMMGGMHGMNGMNGMGMNGMQHPGTNGMEQPNTIHVVTHKGADDVSHRRLAEQTQTVKDKEYKIIQKCVAIQDKDICLTYYYFDRSITLDYNVKQHRLLTTENVDKYKYFKTFAWIWKEGETEDCNEGLLEDINGRICIDGDRNVVVRFNKYRKNKIIKMNEQRWTEMYDVEFMRDDGIIHKKRMCQSILFGKANRKICVETFDDKIGEKQVSIQRMIENN